MNNPEVNKITNEVNQAIAKTYEVKDFCNVQSKKINWLLEGLIAEGKITIVQGLPGCGKSTFALKVTSHFSNAEDIYGNPLVEPIKTLLLSAEDDYEDSIKPKLDRMGANLSNIIFIKTVKKQDYISLDDERLEEVIKKYDVKLVIIDPFQAYLPDETDMNKMKDIRKVMSNLIEIAKECKCAFVILQHLNKNISVKQNVLRGSGSLDINAAARVVVTISKPSQISAKGESRNLRYAQISKSNIGPDDICIFFRLNSGEGIEWVMKDELSEDELAVFKPADASSKKDSVRKFLMEQLSVESQNASILLDRAMNELSVSRETVNIVKRELNILSTKVGSNWVWSLPTTNH